MSIAGRSALVMFALFLAGAILEGNTVYFYWIGVAISAAAFIMLGGDE